MVSALVFGGNVARLRLAWQDECFIPLASKATITELIRVLAYPKFKLKTTEQEDLLSDYLPFCDTVLMPEALPVIPECRDIYDKPFLVLALVGHADYLVTNELEFSNCLLPVPDFCKKPTGHTKLFATLSSGQFLVVGK